MTKEWPRAKQTDQLTLLVLLCLATMTTLQMGLLITASWRHQSRQTRRLAPVSSQAESIGGTHLPIVAKQAASLEASMEQIRGRRTGPPALPQTPSLRTDQLLARPAGQLARMGRHRMLRIRRLQVFARSCQSHRQLVDSLIGMGPPFSARVGSEELD